MLTKNPDPNVEPLTVAMYKGTSQFFNGTLRTRYDILQELKAPEETQREMQNLIGYCMFTTLIIGGIFGIAIGMLIGKVI